MLLSASHGRVSCVWWRTCKDALRCPRLLRLQGILQTNVRFYTFDLQIVLIHSFIPPQGRFLSNFARFQLAFWCVRPKVHGNPETKLAISHRNVQFPCALCEPNGTEFSHAVETYGITDFWLLRSDNPKFDQNVASALFFSLPQIESIRPNSFLLCVSALSFSRDLHYHWIVPLKDESNREREWDTGAD